MVVVVAAVAAVVVVAVVVVAAAVAAVVAAAIVAVAVAATAVVVADALDVGQAELPNIGGPAMVLLSAGVQEMAEERREGGGETGRDRCLYLHSRLHLGLYWFCNCWQMW